MMRTVFFLLLFPALMTFLPGTSPARDYPLTQLRLGGEVASLSLRNILSKEERRYLGLTRSLFDFRKKKVFFINEIQADYIVLEFLNRYCVSCLTQAPILNDLYHKISKDDALRDRVKILAIGVGNNQREVQRFREEKKVPFPIIPDPEFKAYEVFGNPGGTPYFLILRQSTKGLLLADSHLGVIQTGDTLLSELRTLIPLDLASFQKKSREEDLVFKTKRVDVSWSEEEIREKIKRLLRQNGKKEQLSLQKKDWPEYENLYIVDSLSPADENRWFAKVYRCLPLCDLCHPVSFLLIFDKKGLVTSFLPLHVTKYGNVSLTPADTENLRRKIVGRHLEQRHRFQPEYDSVTGATMSASLIFDSLNKAGELYRHLQQAGYASAP